MHTLCIGPNILLTDTLTTDLAKKAGCNNYGLISNIDNHDLDVNTLVLKNGFYHTSVADLHLKDILSLSSRFDNVILLNVDHNLWPDNQTMYKNYTLKDIIPNIISDDKNITEFWKNLVVTNKSFCIYPFIQLMIDNGHTIACCRDRKAISIVDDKFDFKTDEGYKEFRSDLINGVLRHDHCSECYRYENTGAFSARQVETVEWATRLRLKNLNDLEKIEYPMVFDIRPSNVCNLQCRMCNPTFSNLIADEYNEIGLMPLGHQSRILTSIDVINIDDAVKITISGGEPTAMTEFYTLLERCIKSKNTGFDLFVVTNAAKINNKILNLTKHFSRLTFSVSIDGYKLANDYSRWGSHWDNVIENITRMISNGNYVIFNVTVSIYTIFSFNKLLQFLEKTFPECLINLQYVYYTDNLLDPFIIPYSQTLLNKLNDLKNLTTYKTNRRVAKFVDALINQATSSILNKEKLRKFFEFNDLLDNSRCVKLADYIPELEAYRNEC